MNLPNGMEQHGEVYCPSHCQRKQVNWASNDAEPCCLKNGVKYYWWCENLC